MEESSRLVGCARCIRTCAWPSRAAWVLAWVLFGGVGGISAPLVAFGFGAYLGVDPDHLLRHPTALDQPTLHSVHLAIELSDIAEPDVNMETLRYALQFRNLQWITDLRYAVEPRKEFDYLESKLKLRFLDLYEYRFALAGGILYRAVKRSEERAARIDSRSASLLLVGTMEVYPWEPWYGVLLNAYLDNRLGAVGAQMPVHEFIRLKLEGEQIWSSARKDHTNVRFGVGFGGDSDYSLQLFYTDQGERWVLQVGGGF